MKKYSLYAYGVALIVLLILIGRVADDLLLTFLQFYDLIGAPYIRTYLLLISIILLISSYLLIATIKSPCIDKKFVLRILIGIVVGAFGSVWMMMVFMSPDL